MRKDYMKHSIAVIAVILMMGLGGIAAESPLVWDILARHVDREDGQIVSVIFVVRVEHPTFQEHYWRRMDPQPDPDSVSEISDNPRYVLLSNNWHIDDVRPMRQEFGITVSVEYGGEKLSAEQRTAVKALLRQEARRLRDEWMNSLIPASPERRSRQSLTKAELAMLLGGINP